MTAYDELRQNTNTRTGTMRLYPTTLLATLTCTLLSGCNSTKPTVTQFGEMRAVMREGHTEGRISLADAIAQPGAIGVGALEGLAGEITIIDGDVWVSRVTEDDLDVTGPSPIDGDQASLLTLAHVTEWQTVTIESAVDGGDLESLIEQAALALGIDTTKPFPFVIEGKLADIDIHVINGYCPIATDPATVDAKPWNGSASEPTDAIIVGFFAKDAAGVMTHHGTAIHAHAILAINGKTVTGHIDHVLVTAGMTLRLPAAD